MYNKSEIVIYPNHGVSKINKIYSEEINGKTQQYYELSFSEGLILSIPVTVLIN